MSWIYPRHAPFVSPSSIHITQYSSHLNDDCFIGIVAQWLFVGITPPAIFMAQSETDFLFPFLNG